MKLMRVRFAPSPTGFLHIGGARTAIFNYLLAKHNEGKFLLRIEDTDQARSKPEYEEEILEALKWLGLDWDEEPLHQSTRRSFHREAVDELIERGAAYRCFVPPEKAQNMKEAAMKRGEQVAFRSPDRYLTPAESEERMINGEPFAVRFMVPDEPVVYRDGVHGKVEVSPDTIEDFIIMRRDTNPTYQIAVVADDYEMGITHVIRGDDHISNTPKQILIYNALGWTPPEFAHVPLIHGQDKKRLSKRHGATAITDFREKGYLPESILSYLALLGWYPGEDKEIITREELIEKFTVEGINNHSAIFDEQKLEWMNGQFISLLPDDYLIKQLQPYLAEKILNGELPQGCGPMLPKAVSILKTRCRFPKDVIDRGDYFFKDPETILDAKAAKKRLKDPKTPEYVEELANRYEALDVFDVNTSDQVLREYAEENEIGAGKLIHPTRLAVSGQAAGPGLFELLEGLGQETVVRRLRWLAGFMREKGTPPQLD